MADEMDRVQERVEAELARNLARVTSRQVMASAFYCEECDEEIPAVRRAAIVGVQTCVACQELIERRAREFVRGNQ